MFMFFLHARLSEYHVLMAVGQIDSGPGYQDSEAGNEGQRQIDIKFDQQQLR